MTPLWHVCLDRFFSQRIHSFWLSPLPSGYLSQIGLVISWKFLLILLRFLLIFCPSVCITMDLTPNKHGLELHKADGFLVFLLCRISICGTRISFSAEFPATVLSEGSCCSESLWIFLSFFLHMSNSVCLERSSVSTGWPGEGGTYHKLAELQCTVLWTCKILFKSLHL